MLRVRVHQYRGNRALHARDDPVIFNAATARVDSVRMTVVSLQTDVVDATGVVIDVIISAGRANGTWRIHG